MSTFTVSTRTINRCVSGMYRHWQGGDAETLLGQRLMRLNRAALDERYPGRHDDMKASQPEIEGYRHSPQAPNPYLFLVALECLLYQCSEGEVVKDPLYGEVECAVNHWRGTILSAIPRTKPQLSKPGSSPQDVGEKSDRPLISEPSPIQFGNRGRSHPQNS